MVIVFSPGAGRGGCKNLVLSGGTGVTLELTEQTSRRLLAKYLSQHT